MRLANIASLALGLAQQIPLEQNILSLNYAESVALEKMGLESVMERVLEDNAQAIASELKKKSKALKFERRSDWDIVATSTKFPNHQIRARNPIKLGVDHVKQWSGYIDILDQDKHFFFWFFESRSSPSTDPVVLWLNGGPGCSSSTGEFFELGPSSVDENMTLHYNPYSWNNKANVFFLDQPVNVGFSYSENDVDTSTLAAADVYSFLSLFFEEFPEYNGRDFHIAGESYGGHYLPAIGYEILQHEDRNFNLTSLMIGNGITDGLNQAESSISMACGLGGYKSVLEPDVCDELYTKLPRCQQLIQACYDMQTPLVCVASEFYCQQLSSPYYKTGRNAYDIRDVCYDNCYPEINYIETYLSQPGVQAELGVEPTEFAGCDDDVFTKFTFKGDLNLPFHHHVASILEAQVPILIYAGDKDYICNWLGNQAWTDKLEWYLHDEFASTELEPWYVDGKQAGETKNAGHFTFLRVFGAGHMVPFNKPKQSLVMFNKWISGDLTLKGE